MQASRVALVYNLTGQIVEFFPPELEVVPFGPPTSAATYAIWRGSDSNDNDPVLSGTATLDSVSTTVATTAAGKSQTNRRAVTVASASGITTRRSYCLANASLQREIVTPYEVSTTLQLENELRYDHPITTSTLRGLRQYFTIDSTFIQTQSNINAIAAYVSPDELYRRSSKVGPAPPYRVRWRYITGDSITREAWTYFDVVRQRGKHNVTANSLRALFPDISDFEWAQYRGQQLAQQIEAGWDRLCWDVRMASYGPDQIREGPIVDELVRRATLMIVAEAGATVPGRDKETYIREKQQDYRSMFSQSIGSALHAWIDQGTTGGIHSDPQRTFRLRK